MPGVRDINSSAPRRSRMAGPAQEGPREDLSSSAHAEAGDEFYGYVELVHKHKLREGAVVEL